MWIRIKASVCNYHWSHNMINLAKSPVSLHPTRPRPYATSLHLPMTHRMVRPSSSRQPQEQEDEPYIQLQTSAADDGDMWSVKPWWCQPWTILMTGATGISLSWLLFNSFVVTSIASALVFAWWYLFLILVPESYKRQSK